MTVRARTKMTEVESIIGHYVTDLLIAPDGTPWFAGNHGIAHYHNGQFEALADSAKRHAIWRLEISYLQWTEKAWSTFCCSSKESCE